MKQFKHIVFFIGIKYYTMFRRTKSKSSNLWMFITAVCICIGMMAIGNMIREPMLTISGVLLIWYMGHSLKLLNGYEDENKQIDD